MSVVQVYNNYMEANIVRGMLEEEGIPAALDNENTMTIIPVLGNATGGIRLMVPEPEAERARSILAKIDNEKRSAHPCPKCGSTNVELVSSPRNPSTWLSAIASTFLGDYAIAGNKVYHCFDCDNEFGSSSDEEIPTDKNLK